MNGSVNRYCILRMFVMVGNNGVTFKIFRTGGAFYAAVVLARSTVPNWPNCEFRVLLRSLVAAA
jgi:hypothetical protein